MEVSLLCECFSDIIGWIWAVPCVCHGVTSQPLVWSDFFISPFHAREIFGSTLDSFHTFRGREIILKDCQVCLRCPCEAQQLTNRTPWCSCRTFQPKISMKMILMSCFLRLVVWTLWPFRLSSGTQRTMVQRAIYQPNQHHSVVIRPSFSFPLLGQISMDRLVYSNFTKCFFCIYVWNMKHGWCMFLVQTFWSQDHVWKTAKKSLQYLNICSVIFIPAFLLYGELRESRNHQGEKQLIVFLHTSWEKESPAAPHDRFHNQNIH